MKRSEAMKKVEQIIEDNKPQPTKEETEKILKEAYPLIIQTLKKYCDLKEEYYSLITIWILGTYFHQSFPTYPYLFFNAMRGSGKTRLLNLICTLTRKGEVINSLTEAVLFRENNCIGIDEFEDAGKKGFENLKELLNVAYKKGGVVKRARKIKNLEGENQEIQTFQVYRPIAMANISGMDNILGDRCIKCIVEKSVHPKKTRRMETFDLDKNILYIKKLLIPFETCIVVYSVYFQEVYKGWDEFVDQINENEEMGYMGTSIHTIHNYTQLYTTIYNNGFLGRDLELTFPLLILSYMIDEMVFNSSLKALREIVFDRKEEDIFDNKDVALYDFISQETTTFEFILVKDLTRKFKEFLQTEDEEITPSWVGYALKRLGLIKKKMRKSYGQCVIIDYKKAQEKIKMFK